MNLNLTVSSKFIDNIVDVISALNYSKKMIRKRKHFWKS